MRRETNDSPLFSPVTSFRDVSIDFISRGCIIAMRSRFKACSWNRNITASCLENPFMDDRTYIRTSLRDSPAIVETRAATRHPFFKHELEQICRKGQTLLD